MDRLKVVLAGNPNVGKSVFFNALTGIYADVSNFPGTTVDLKAGRFLGYDITDTPGVYGVSSFNDEERVAKDVIVDADIVIDVVDALQLRRDLFLTIQLIDMGKRVIVCLNMMDEVEKNGVGIEVDKLSSLLGVPIIPTSAIRGMGIDELKNSIDRAKCGNKTNRISSLLWNGINTAHALLIAEDDPEMIKKYKKKSDGLRDEIYTLRRRRIEEIADGVIFETTQGADFSTRLGRLMLTPKMGVPILIATLIAMFLIIGVLVSGYLVNLTEDCLMGGIYSPFVRDLVSKLIGEESIWAQFLIGNFGVLTMVPTYIIGLLLPLVISFYFLLSVMEDSGYLPRLATLLDRLMTRIGLNGRAIIPIILGFGCVTVATISTRLLGSNREKVITTALLGLTIPCSAQMGVIMGRVAALGVKYTLIYAITILVTFILIGKVLNKTLSGESTTLLIDLPRLRLPKMKNVITKTYLKSKQFLFEAAPLFLLGAVVITFLQVSGLLNRIIDGMVPLTEGVLRLPRQSATAFIMGMIRRDFGVAGLADLPLSSEQVLVAMTAMTLFVPCIASVLMIFKERSIKEATLIWLGSFALAFFIGGVLAYLL